MKLFIFLLPYLFTGLAVPIIAVLIERLLIFVGWTPGSTVELIIFGFISSVLWQLMKFPQPISFNFFEILFFIPFLPLAINRFELYKTIQKGRWWWKTEVRNK